MTSENALPARLESAAIDRQPTANARLETLSQLVGAVTHDLNNLLATISNCSALIARHLADQDDVSDLTNIRAAVSQGAAMSRQLASLARRSDRNPELLALNDLVRASRARLELAVRSEIHVRLNLPDESAMVFVDRQQIELLMMNLALNAADSMPAGGLLTITVTDAGPDDLSSGSRKGKVKLVFVDQGKGMDGQIVEHAFEPFFTTKATSVVAGLGLTTVYGIVAQNGGAVTVASIVGSGTTVTVLLPIADPAAPGSSGASIG